MSEKMRVSMHNGRGNSKHNDRSFLKDWTDDEIKEKAPHIDKSKIKDNYYWATQQGDKKLSEGATFEEIELSFYEKFFSKALEETNQNYIKQGHAERVKTMKSWYKSKQKAPFETILQVGDRFSDIDPAIFKKMCIDYVNYINKKYGKHIKTLDFAIHYDESSPHMHLRQVYVYEDVNKTLKLGQNKALEQLGIDLPNPKEKASRKNNRKMTLDKELRSKWQEIAKSYGYDIETEPRINIRHKDKEEYINEQIAKQEQIFQLNDAILKKHNMQTTNKKGLLRLLNKIDMELVSKEELKALKLNSERVEALEKELRSIRDNPNKILRDANTKSQQILLKNLKRSKELEQKALELEQKAQEIAEKSLKYNENEIKANTLDKLKRKYPKEMESMIKTVETVVGSLFDEIEQSKVREPKKELEKSENDEQSFFDNL